MLELVLWSFVLALAPLVLALAWRLTCGVGRVIDHRQSGELTPASGEWRPPTVYKLDLSSSHRPRPRDARWWEP